MLDAVLPHGYALVFMKDLGHILSSAKTSGTSYPRGGKISFPEHLGDSFYLNSANLFKNGTAENLLEGDLEFTAGDNDGIGDIAYGNACKGFLANKANRLGYQGIGNRQNI